MATDKDRALVEYLKGGTESGEVRWEPTAQSNEFSASLKGKYVVVIHRQGTDCWLQLRDAEDRELLRLNLSDFYDGRISWLFDQAQRSALNVDSAIDEILGGGGEGG